MKKLKKTSSDSSGGTGRLWRSGSALGGSGGALGWESSASIYRKTHDQPHSSRYAIYFCCFLKNGLQGMLTKALGRFLGTSGAFFFDYHRFARGQQEKHLGRFLGTYIYIFFFCCQCLRITCELITARGTKPSTAKGEEGVMG